MFWKLEKSAHLFNICIYPKSCYKHYIFSEQWSKNTEIDNSNYIFYNYPLHFQENHSHNPKILKYNLNLQENKLWHKEIINPVKRCINGFFFTQSNEYFHEWEYLLASLYFLYTLVKASCKIACNWKNKSLQK